MVTKAVREIRATLTQMDALFPTLSGKPAADILCEKASLVKTLLAEEREADQTSQAAKIAELDQKLSVSAVRISELEKQNAELQTAASTRKVEHIPDPNHAAVKEERDALEKVVTILAAGLSENPDVRAETAVKVAQSVTCRRVVESFCRSVAIDAWNLNGYLAYTESALRRLQTAKDSNGVLVRAILAVKFPPVKIETETPAPPPDTRSWSEKYVAEAIASTRRNL